MDNTLKVKICGMTDRNNLESVSQLRPEWLGFIFHRASPRHAYDVPLTVFKSLDVGITPVAVFVNPDYDTVLSICNSRDIKTVQLHGCESPELLDRLRDAGLTVLKALHLGITDADEQINRYAGHCDMMVFDNAKGGSGSHFDWAVLENIDIPKPWLLSGGLAPGDEQAIIKLKRRHPQTMVGVDLNSRFEIRPGVKDTDKLAPFIDKIHLII